MKTKQNELPRNARRIWRVADLPTPRTPAKYEIRNENAAPRCVTLQKRQRQILDLLIAGPVYCASPVRISDIVHILRREIDLDVTTEMFRGSPKTGAGDYGVYTLRSRVRRLQELEVAA